MEFEKIQGPVPAEYYYRGVLLNGLTVYVYPMPGKTGVHAMLSAEIGSTTRDFTLDGRAVRAPAGVAHFLEHKLFEGEDGTDAFSLFARTGAYANAYTSFDRTCYLFGASDHIEESLRTLIRFVSQPHFTAENVRKEQGIIAQEIRMYDDNADWVLTNMMLRCLYSAHPIRDDIAGTVESIAEITPALLYDCYRAFYSPANMTLAIAGNIEPETVGRICGEEYAEPVQEIRVELAVPDEPQTVHARKEQREMVIFETQFCLGYKEKPLAPDTALQAHLLTRVLLELIAGETSALYRRLYDEGLINGMFDASTLVGNGYFCNSFSGESAKPELVVAAIKSEIARQKREGIDAARFEECRRALIGAELCAYDSVEGVASKMTHAHFKKNRLSDIMDIVQSMDVQAAEEMLAQILDEESSAVAIIMPRDEIEEIE